MSSSPYLRTQNLRWLCILVALDVAILAISASIPQLEEKLHEVSAVARYGTSAFLPVVLLLLSSLISSAAKDRLVFWRRQHVLPGHRAFSEMIHRDPRIDVDDLRRHIGELPIDPAKQNALWYKLYKTVKHDPIVLESHKLFLLFRDAAAISFLLALAAAALLLVNGLPRAALTAGAIFLGQYVLSVIASRHHATRFVCNVLVLQVP